MGAQGIDIQLSKAAVDQFPFSTECKKYAKFAIYQHYEQATANCLENTKPLLVIEGDRKPALVVLSLEDFLEIL